MDVCRLAIAPKCVWSNLAALRYGRYGYSSRDVRLRDRFASIRATVQFGFESPNGRHFVVVHSRRVGFLSRRIARAAHRFEAISEFTRE